MQETNNAEEKEEIYLLPVCFVAFCLLLFYFVLIYQKKKKNIGEHLKILFSKTVF